MTDAISGPADLEAALPSVSVNTVAGLRDLHTLLVATAATVADPPVAALKRVALLLATDGSAPVSQTPPRERVALVLLAAGSSDAAWQLLRDTAALGTKRPAIATVVEPPRVFADLPGFRDPRADGSEDCYDVSDAVTLAVTVDEVWRDGDVVRLGGSAVHSLLATEANDRVCVVLTAPGGGRQSVVGQRHRRPDLVKGTGSALTRRAWGGWSASVPLDDRGHGNGPQVLSLEVEHRGIVRSAGIGRNASVAATAVAAGCLDVSTTPWRLPARF